MEILSENSELRFQYGASQFDPTAAAWHVLGLLLSHCRPDGPSDMDPYLSLSCPCSDFMRFLCSIPNSPLRFVENHLVTLSQVGVAAIARYLTNSDSEHLRSRLRSNGWPDNMWRTHCGKRKRLLFEIDDFHTMKKRSHSQTISGGLTLSFTTEESNLKLISMTMSGAFQNLCCHDICMLSSPSSSLMGLVGWKLEKNIFRGPMLANSSHKQLCCKIKNFRHPYNYKEATFGSRKELSYLERKRCESVSLFQGRFLLQHGEIISKVKTNSIPRPMHRVINLGESNTDDADVVNPIHCKNIGDSIKLEVGKHMTVSAAEDEPVIHVCESSDNDVNAKRSQVSFFGSGECRSTIPVDRSNIWNPDKNLAETSNMELSLVAPRAEAHPQSQGDMVDQLIQHSSIPKSTRKDEKKDRGKASHVRMEKYKSLFDAAPEQLNVRKKPIIGQRKLNSEQRLRIEQQREISMKNQKIASSKSVNHMKQKHFPHFEMFITEEEEGSGGYGIVYRATRKVDGVTVAIKCPHVDANRKYIHNELKMLERFGGRNFIIKFQSSFKNENGDCLVLDHVEHDRPEILKREINIIQLQWYGYCLFKALASLHKQGIVHRDVKPGNFLYSCKVNKGYLIDFNLALDMNKQYGISASADKKDGHYNFDVTPTQWTKSLPHGKSRKLTTNKFPEGANINAVEVSKSVLPPGKLKQKYDKAKAFNEKSSKSITISQGADGSGITSAKDTSNTRILSAERLREPLPSQGRKQLISLAQEALQNGNHEFANTLISKRKRVVATPGQAQSKYLYPTPMPLHADSIAIAGAGPLISDRKHKKVGPCVGTKGFKAPEVLFRSLHQGPKADIWSAGVTLLYLMIGRSPFVGDTDQNLKEIANFRGSEELWEVARLHNQESLFPPDLLDIKYLSPVKLEDWCARNTRRPDLLKAIPRSLFDLVDRCLIVNPRQRISAEEALRHNFLAQCHKSLVKQEVQS